MSVLLSSMSIIPLTHFIVLYHFLFFYSVHCNTRFASLKSPVILSLFMYTYVFMCVVSVPLCQMGWEERDRKRDKVFTSVLNIYIRSIQTLNAHSEIMRPVQGRNSLLSHDLVADLKVTGVQGSFMVQNLAISIYCLIIPFYIL